MRQAALRLMLLVAAAVAAGTESFAAPASAGPGIPLLLPPGARPPAELGGRVVETNASGDATASERGPLIERIRPVPPPGGADGLDWVEVEYTIDRALEARVRQVLERERVGLGQVVLMDPQSGDLLAYVSTDPVAFPATRTYPMASLAKVVTAAAALRSVPDVARRDCRYVGSPYALGPEGLVAPQHGGSVEPFWRALAISNNQCFARLAVHEVGAEAILGELAGVGLLEAPAPGHPPGRFEPVGDALALGRLGSGLAGSFISPLAAVRLAALLARGELVRPRWIRRIAASDGRPVELPAPEAPQRVWSPELAAQLREILVGVTTRGTARRAFVDASGEPLLGAVRVSGKTGTLSGRDPEGLYRWFIGVAPADAPRIAVATLAVNGAEGHGAARIAAEILRELLCDRERCAPEILERHLAPSLGRRLELLARDAAEAAPAQPEPPAPVEAAGLDAVPRPIGVAGLELPRRLRDERVDGRIVLLLELSPEGRVLDVAIDSSDLPAFEAFVARAVRAWRFTPPTRGGIPVQARARLPIPIHVE